MEGVREAAFSFSLTLFIGREAAHRAGAIEGVAGKDLHAPGRGGQSTKLLQVRFTHSPLALTFVLLAHSLPPQRSIDKYEDSQKKLLYTDKFYHGDNNIVKRGPEWGEEGAENNKLLSAVVSEPASPGRVRFNSSESITNMPAKFANTKNSKFNHTTDKITHISSGFGSLVPRLSMARIRDQNRPVRIIREMRKQNSPQVREQAFRVIEAACFSGGHQVVKVYVGERDKRRGADRSESKRIEANRIEAKRIESKRSEAK